MTTATATAPRLKTRYREQIVASLQEQFSYGNPMQVPGLVKVVVEGVNRVKKHTPITSTQRGAKAGGIETIEAPISASNVMVIDGDGKATRVGYRRDEESGKNKRVSRRSGKDL